jgi:CheY-like chemotaxis protein
MVGFQVRVLIVEDNVDKKNRLSYFVKENIKGVVLNEADSYNAGVRAIKGEKYDLILLDMSMPTFSKTLTDGGGRVRVFGGRDILSHLKRKRITTPVILVTQFDAFESQGNKVSLAQVADQLTEEYKEIYLGTVFYSRSTSAWENELSEMLKKVNVHA